ncbi:MAG: hypothetical protein ACAH59_00235 [Pseudobdellovibrionaceae bacterium]
MKKILILLPIALLSMANQKCEDKPQSRELRRRVELGMITAPQIQLPEGGKFDFQFAANAQLQDVLRKTQSFSTSTMDGTFELEQMTMSDREEFNRCDDDVLTSENSLQAKARGEHSIVATCMINAPQASINGAVTGFELTNSVGLTVNLIGSTPISAGFQAKKAVLTMAFDADDPFIDGHHLASSTPKANRREFSVNFGYGFLGFNGYFKSDLAGVVHKAMTSGILDLKKQMDQNSPWFATILRNCDTHILINAGGAADAGLKEGDVLEVYNVQYEWKGKICESQLQNSIPDTDPGKPIAVAVVRRVGDTVSRAEIIQQDSNGTKIQPGSRVYLKKMVPPKDSKNTSQQKLAGS